VLPDATDTRARPRIGRYAIVGRIGRGGMGMVYRGLDEDLEREVAIKTLTAEGSLDEDSRKRFRREGLSTAKLQHPNIVTVYEVGEDRGVAFIAMEFLQGMDLEALMRSGEELLLGEKLDIVIQVCRGLAYAHERRIVHRDIKPSNICVLDDGTAKIMDFGIVKLIGGTQLTKTGMVVGTVHYMSPEQVQGRPLDGRSDVFSLGCILYQLLAGQRPFRAEDPTAVLYKIVHEPPPPFDLSPLAELGPRLMAIVERALAKDPAARYPGAAELGADLADALAAHRRSLGVAPGPALIEALTAARRTRVEGRIEEATATLQKLAADHPTVVEARRELRAARQAQERQRRTPAPQAEDYPELEATFQPPTRSQPGTTLQPTIVVEPAVASGTRKVLLGGVALALAAAATAAVLLLRGGRPAPAEVRIAVRSQPMGAAVLVDGRDTGVTTNGEIVLPAPAPAEVTLTFRKPGHREETRTLRLPLSAGEGVSVALQVEHSTVPVVSEPAGATVTLDGQRVAGVTPLELALDPAREHLVGVALDGHAAQEVRVAVGTLPSELRVRLAPLAPPGAVAITSSYPLDVQWRGRTLAHDATSPRVQVPEGRQVLTLVSATLFLREEVTVSVPSGGEVAVAAPGVGRLSVRAIPDSCRVFVDGTFVDYPPILDHPIAAGTHTVGFRWPDGEASEQAVEVAPGVTAFATGRKDRR